MLITIIVVLVVAALLYWALTNLGLPPMIQKVGTVVLVLVVCVWLINLAFPGHLGSLGI